MKHTRRSKRQTRRLRGLEQLAGVVRRDVDRVDEPVVECDQKGAVIPRDPGGKHHALSARKVDGEHVPRLDLTPENGGAATDDEAYHSGNLRARQSVRQETVPYVAGVTFRQSRPLTLGGVTIASSVHLLPIEVGMSLVTCADCAKEVSARAQACPHCGRPHPGRSATAAFRPQRKRAFFAGAALLLMAVLVGTLSSVSGARGIRAAVDSASTEPITVPETLTHVVRDSLSRLRDSLKTHFVIVEISSGSGFYQHRNQLSDDTYNRTYLYAPVSLDGALSFASQYFGEDWIFHERLIVDVGDRRFETETYPVDSPKNIRTSVAGSVWEALEMGTTSNGVLRAIAENPEARVRVTMVGRQRDHSFDLSRRDKVAIAESVRFSDILLALSPK